MNTIKLKRNLDFQHYQLAIKALESVGIEIDEPNPLDLFELTSEEIEKIQVSIGQIKNSKLVLSQEEVMQKIKEKYENSLDN